MKEYTSPLVLRYSSKKMIYLFSEEKKYTTWRKIWVWLAESQKELGLNISDRQIADLKKNINNINIETAVKYEEKLQHDVMAHIHAFGDQAPLARPIIHLGATSCLVTDNAELIIIKEGLLLIKNKLILLIEQLKKLSIKYKDYPCVSYTHFQIAQPTTFGKRISMWLQDFTMDLEDLDYRINTIKALGIKGATGTQASFLDLFDQDHKKVEELEKIMIKKMKFNFVFKISGQTYTRKQDIQIADLLASFAASAHKFATDFRLLVHLGVMDEPIKKSQVGSSAMPYKRNPILSERICSLSRFIISLADNPKYTAALQWLERSLDDSANRRLTLSEIFLTTDAVLELLIKITNNPVVYTKMIDQQLEESLPFLATEQILMQSVKKGGDRQEVHEVIRQHSLSVAEKIKGRGLNSDINNCSIDIEDNKNNKNNKINQNNLLELLGNDEKVPLSYQEIVELLNNVNLTGRASEQVSNFVEEL